ncbi:MAG: hypothetical protein VKJ66_01635 [Synechococcus sp.]|nr:hypothetical protein [Synechococcus sp.]
MAYPSLSGSPLPAPRRSPSTPGLTGGGPAPHRQAQPSERDHQLEKLEFALAVALTKGDASRAEALREQISALGGNNEEPGT